jgi:phenylpropionate dioxygenase-like ring-hydroxylating dioxygenase large terminal subunit
MPLSMKPTGWFQVAWSEELSIGEVKPLHYLGQELVLYRTEDGIARVLDAYCEHLGAHLGYGGTVSEDCIVCPFHGWRWDPDGRNTEVPYQARPNRARRVRAWPVCELNESIFIWHDLEAREPLFDVPDVFAAFDDGAVAAKYYVAYPEGICSRERVPLHPQYVIENGVDFAHFKFVHKAHQVPRLLHQEFSDWAFSAEFEMSFPAPRGAVTSTTDGLVHGGVQALNVGLGLGYSVAWSADRMRLQVAVTPVDDETSDIRSTVWLERLPGDVRDHQPPEMEGRMRIANRQFLADVHIWEHQRYTDPAGLAAQEVRGFTAVRRWATRFYSEPTAHVS